LKWSKKAYIAKINPYLLDLRRSTKDFLIGNNIIKTDILIDKFFPKIKTINFSNIAIEATINQKVLNISFSILIEKISKLIKTLLNGKALRLDGILNKILKVVILVIVKNLIKIASHCLTSKIILKCLRDCSVVNCLHFIIVQSMRLLVSPVL